MKVFGASTYLIEEEKRARRIASFLKPLAPAFLAMAAVGWILVAAGLGGRFLPNGVLQAMVGVASLLGLGAYMLPDSADSFKQRADNFARGLEGEEIITEKLAEKLDDSWTLFRSVILPGRKDDIDAVLVGKTGVYALEIKNYSRPYRNKEWYWDRRISQGRWVKAKGNPSRQAQDNAERLNQWFQKKGVDVAAEPRVVWAGDGLLIADEPAIPIWQLNNMEQVTDMLFHRSGVEGGLEAETLSQVLADLSKVVS